MLVDEKFSEWTAGLDKKNALISVFEHIRDIPYSIAVSMTDPDTAPEQLLLLGKGYCGPKHYLLAVMYRRLGYEVVFTTIPFLWNDPDLLYPAELRRLAAGLPVAYHLACRVRINTCWVLVDATWDLPLARGGFPVNRNWDGKTDTLCAVKPLESTVQTAFSRTATSEPYRKGQEQKPNPRKGEKGPDDTREHAGNYRRRIRLRTQEDVEQIHRFYQEFDTWLQEIRKGP